jgi:hypothetical protein
MAFLRLLSSPVGAGPGKLLVHVFLDSGCMEFLDKAENGVKATQSCSPEIGPYTDNFLFGCFSGVKISDLPSSPFIRLRAVQKSNHEVGAIEMRFAVLPS